MSRGYAGIATRRGSLSTLLERTPLPLEVVSGFRTPLAPMSYVYDRWLMARPLWLLRCLPARAPTSTVEFLPEIDTDFRLNSTVQLVFQAKEAREGGAPTQGELGPSIDFFPKPLFNLHDLTVFDPDPLKSRTFILSAGYRYLPTLNKPSVNRLEPVLTFHIPIKGRILTTDRNRAWTIQVNILAQKAVADGAASAGQRSRMLTTMPRKRQRVTGSQPMPTVRSGNTFFRSPIRAIVRAVSPRSKGPVRGATLGSTVQGNFQCDLPPSWLAGSSWR